MSNAVFETGPLPLTLDEKGLRRASGRLKVGLAVAS